MMGTEYSRLHDIRARIYDHYNEWADKRDDASAGTEDRKLARYTARYLEDAMLKVDKAIALHAK